ncbi:MAG: ABC transporter ATP-binding protein [Ruminococcus sp.]|uniref:ABC transporter ATP-binding protein n=1 Tax=Ruminococcus sp. TaxID=41978 RepID=UPI002872DF23|nr:ABC transporter ATP-binding protein [Ruminococcus sp.]MBQ3285006.1 ABC transporter ATP-binding protein [Ruminococcus sp.]
MFKLLFKNMKAKNWISVIAIFLLTLGEVFFMMQIVSYISLLTGAVQNSRENGVAEIWWYGLYMVICAIMMAAIEVVIRFVASATASSCVTGIRQRMYERVNKFAISDFASFSTESLITRTTNDMQNVHLAWLTFLKTAFLSPVVMVWSVILLMQYASTSLTIVTAIWLVLLVVAVVVLLMMLTPKFKIVQKLTDALNVASRENLTGVRVVRAFNAETYQENKFEKVNTNFTRVQIFAGRVMSFFTPFVMMVMSGLSLSILWASAYVLNGMDMETAAQSFSATNAFVMLASQIIMSFVLMVTLIVIWPRAAVSAKRINEVITHEVSVLDPENPVDFKEKGTIEFKNVGFAYPGSDKEAVSDISFKVKKGETIAFIGATGSGKTTIINMIPRMADCTRGEVLVDGVNVKNVLQKDLRDRIGYTPQRGFLFKGNIKDNIAFKDSDMTLEDVRWAAKIADADDFVMSKRNEYDSSVAQGGTNFSGGQKQRLCIARAVATKPEILIFDDSFSALDYRTDKTVRGRIAEQLPDTTRVIIAQRVGTIMDADQIVVLDNGKMVGIGKHYDLVRNCPVYQEIALSQLSKEELGL